MCSNNNNTVEEFYHMINLSLQDRVRKWLLLLLLLYPPVVNDDRPSDQCNWYCAVLFRDEEQKKKITRITEGDLK